MHYELYLRLPQDATPFTPERLADALRGLDFEFEGQWPARFALSGGQLLVQPQRSERWDGAAAGPDHPETGALSGLDLSFPLGLEDAAGALAIDRSLQLAEALGATVFDPQQGRLVARSESGAVSEAWRRWYEFQSGVVGGANLGPHAPRAPQAPRHGSGLSSRTKFLIGLGLLIFLAITGFRACFNRWMERQFFTPPPISEPTP